MTSAITYHRIWQIAWPVLLSVLVEQLVGLTDTAFLGRVGEVELAASALGGVFFIAMFVVCFGFAQGAQIIMARRNGEGDSPLPDRGEKAIGSVFYHSLAFLLLLATGLFVVIVAGAPRVLRLLISNTEVYEATRTYLDWRVYGIFFSAVACLFRAFFVATTRTGVLTMNSIVMVSANILLDWLLIFGHCGLPAMGIAGAALASSLANAVSMLFYLLYTRRRICLSRYGLDRLPRRTPGRLRRIMSVSLWTMVQDFVSCGTWFLFFLAVEHLGTSELALTNIVRNVSSVCYMAITALGVTGVSLTGNLMGQYADLPAEQVRHAVLAMLRKAMLLCTVLLLPLLLFVLLLPELTLQVFTSDARLIAAGRAPLCVLVSSYLLTVPAQILFRAVSATGNTRTALLFEFISLAAYVGFILVAIVQLRVSVAACWFSEHVYEGTALLLSATYLWRGNWMKKRL